MVLFNVDSRVHPVPIRPDDNYIIKFNEGELHIMGENEADLHGRSSRLYYGKSDLWHGYTNYIELDVLSRLEISQSPLERVTKWTRFPFGYRKADEYNFVKRTIDGGLKITCDNGNRFESSSYFNSVEFVQIRQFFGGHDYFF